MTKFDVKFVIEAQNMGEATNRAMVALYKGDLDATEVSVVDRSGDNAAFKFVDKVERGADNLVSHRKPRDYGMHPSAGMRNVVDISEKRK